MAPNALGANSGMAESSSLDSTFCGSFTKISFSLNFYHYIQNNPGSGQDTNSDCIRKLLLLQSSM